MLLAELATVSRTVAAASRRIAKVDALAACLRRLTPDEVEIGVGLLSGEPRQGRLGVGVALIRDCLSGTTSPSPSLNLTDVDRTLEAISQLEGSGSTAKRRQVLGALFARATIDEQDFLLRLLIGELRQGALEGLMAEAVAKAAALSPVQVRRAAMFAGNLAPVARAALLEGSAGLRTFALQMFQPVQPMLAQPAEDTVDALAQLGTAVLDWKLDGARVQAHKSGSEVRIYTRNLNDVTASVPEIADAVRAIAADELILDGEALALQPDGSPLPFQTTMRRFGRRVDVDRMREQLPLHTFFFDCLRIDQNDIVDHPARERFALMTERLPQSLLVPRLVTSDQAAAQKFFDDALARGHEGIMAKSLDAAYQTGNRGAAWLKVKRANTLDLVVLAAEWGHGRRAGWLSNLHLGARDRATGGYLMLGKTFKGLTDQMLTWQTQALLKLEVARDAYTVHVKPGLVVEVAFNEIQASPHYAGGLALRFARVKRYRTDKRPEEADTTTTVRALFERQSGRSPAQ